LQKHKLYFRSVYGNANIKKIKVEFPGWAGDSKSHSDGATPQPWHCVPFLEASTYGLELIYPFNSEAIIRTVDGKIQIDPSSDKSWEVRSEVAKNPSTPIETLTRLASDEDKNNLH
jgi:hypothetical protein